MCLIGKTELLCMQCWGIMPYLSARRKSNGFSRVAARTWGTFSSNGGDGHSKLEFVQRCQDSCVVAGDTSGLFSRHGRAIGTPLEVWMETQCHFPVATGL